MMIRSTVQPVMVDHIRLIHYACDAQHVAHLFDQFNVLVILSEKVLGVVRFVSLLFAARIHITLR